MKRKFKFLAAALMSASVLIAGCGGGSDETANSTDKNVINIALHQDPPKLDPYRSSAFVERHVFQSLFDKLVELDAKGNIVPALAEKWEISPDGMKYTFYLRKGVKFHDGTDFNAAAVKYNIETYQEKASNRRNEVKTIASVNVVDDYTVEFLMKQPFSPLMALMTDRAGMMRSPAAAEKLGEGFMNAPVGTGPYMFSERTKGNSITLVKNANYWNGTANADKLVYKIMDDANVALVNLKSGQVDMTNRFPLNEAAKYANDKKLYVSNEPGPGFRGYVLNTTNPNLQDARVRKAMEMVMDRETIVKVALFGVGTPGRTALSSGSFAYDAELDKAVKPDIAAAKKLMTEAGKANGFKLTLLTDTDPTSAQVAQLAQRMLKEINIDLVIEKQDFGTMLDRAKKGQFEAAAISWSGRVDPDGNLYDWMYTGAHMNYMKYSEPEIDQWLDEARLTNDQAARKALYKKIMTKIDQDVPYIYLYHENNAYGISKELKGFEYNPDGMIRTLSLTKK